MAFSNTTSEKSAAGRHELVESHLRALELLESSSVCTKNVDLDINPQYMS